MKTNNFTAGQSARNQTAATTTSSLTPDAQRRKLIVERMEREGQSLQSFMDSVKGYVVNGVVALGTLLKQVESAYPGVTVSDRNHLVKECLR